MTTTKRAPKPPVDHSEPRAWYVAYLAKLAELAPHVEYAKRVESATAGGGMTPVMPLATMGCGGGPLLCDHCGKPMLLEGGRFNKVYADAGWKQNPEPNWRSWIKGGMVVEGETNGTVRVYHGYVGRAGHCVNVARAARDAAERAYVSARPADVPNRMYKFLAAEHPETTDAERCAIISGVVDRLFSFDPGIGVNRPG